MQRCFAVNKFAPAGIFLVVITVAAATPGAEPAPISSLPAHMELRYRVNYGAIPVGFSTRTLERQNDDSYHYRLRTWPTGIARIFTHIEWIEEGQFRVDHDQVLPLKYLKYRVGAQTPRREEASFEWDKGRIVYATGGSDSLPAGTQDGNTVIFEMMLHPPTDSDRHEVHITTGKKLIVYDYRFVRRENLDTPLGKFDTLVVRWTERTRNKSGDVFTAWLALDKLNIPVKIVAQQDGQTGTMLIESASGV